MSLRRNKKYNLSLELKSTALKYFSASFLLFTFLFISTTVKSQTILVDPPNWWYDMEVDTVQLMIYGNDISSLDASLLNSNGTKLTRQIQSDNANYQWITLDVSTVDSPTTMELVLSDGGDKIHSVPYTLFPKPDVSDVNGFDQSDAIYLITPDRYSNADPSNDDIPGFKETSDRSNPLSRHGGDLLGIKNHIDDIAKMGFTAIWLNPIIENDNSKYSYHGYAATDFYEVDARFGTNEEYKTFVETCHAKGIKVIMDMIHNHCSSEHWWMSDLPASDWINTFEDYTQTNHIKSTLQDIHASAVDKKTYLDGWFVPSMPDLNQRNKELATYLIQNAIWWSLYLKLDGIRMDTYSYPDPAYMNAWVKAMQNETPQVSIVGEEWSTNPAHIAYWQKGKVNQDGFESDLEYLMDFPTNQILAEALLEKEAWGKGLIKIYESIANDFMYPHPEDLFIFLDNHDMSRGFTNLDENVDLMKMALVFCLTTRGIPQVYYGTEILVTSPKERDDGRVRSDYPGGWPGDEVNAFTGDGLTPDQVEFKSFLTNLLHVRKSEPLLHAGELTHYVPKDGVYIYFRHYDGEKIMVILNKNEDVYALNLKRFSQFLSEDSTQGVDLLTNKQIILQSELPLSPRSSYVIKITN